MPPNGGKALPDILHAQEQAQPLEPQAAKLKWPDSPHITALCAYTSPDGVSTAPLFLRQHLGWAGDVALKISIKDQHHAAPSEAGRGPAGSIPTSGPCIASVCTGSRGPAHQGRLGMAAVPSATLHPEEQDRRQVLGI